jgi:RHS repeat-associated protein
LATVSGTTPLDVPEDPLGQRSEHQTPEISILVDARDGHLTARVVDDWGPGRTPYHYRTYTNTPADTRSAAGAWQLNQIFDVQPTTSYPTGDLRVREPDGTVSTYRYSTAIGAYANTGYVYVKSVGEYATIQTTVNLYAGGPGGCVEFNWTWNGIYTQYLPNGATRVFTGTPTSGGGCQAYGALGWAGITQEKDANGNTRSYTWGAGGGIQNYVSSRTDEVGRTTTYGYEPFGPFICLAENDRGNCIRGGYYYRVKTITDPWGRITTFTYDAGGNVTQVQNAAGFATLYGYDSGGRLTSVTDSRVFPTTITWTATTPARVAQVTAPDVTATVYSYATDASGNVTATTVTDARSNVTKYTVTTAGDVGIFTDPLGNVTQLAYDSNHNVTQVTDALGRVTTYAYNAHNKVTQIVRASGTLNLTTGLSWDSVTTLPYNGKDNLLSVTNPRNITTNNTYDANNNLTSVRRAVGTVDESLTQYTYTPWGGVASLIDPRGNTTTYAYTARHQIQTVTPPVGGTTTYAYDAFDNQASMTDGNSHTWTTAYNASRLPTTVTDPAGNTVGYAYDPNGNRTGATDAKNQVTTFTYDSRDRLTAIKDPLNGTTGYQFDVVSNLIKITNARNLSPTFVYDAANRLTQVTDVLGQATTFGYDQVGNRTSMKDRKGTTSTYSYDQVNRLTQVSGGGITVSYTYDASGNRLTMVDPTGTTGYTYDSLDRLMKVAYPDARSVQYAYDKIGNRTGLTYPGGTATLGYAYDAANRLTQITQGTLSWSFGYDGAGNRTSLTQPNGTNTTYAYQVNNWLSSITHKGPGGAAFQIISYTYDANGNRITQADSSGTTTSGYDALNRLVQAAYPGTYGTWSWAYDPVGNRTSQTAPGGITTYAYDGNNRLTQAGAVVYTYDANGNLTGTTAGQSFTYNVFNRMTQAVGTGGTATYTYNGDGRKIQRIGPDGVTRYYYSGIRPIWETDGAGVMTAELDRDIFGNLLSRLDSSGTRRYYHTDGLGSTIVLTDATGNFAAGMLYDGWGNVRASTADVGKYRFAGAEMDTASGLYHMGARFYDPSVGRWLSEDPIQKRFEPISLNFYTYVANNPFLLVDPTGTMVTQEGGGCDAACQQAAQDAANKHQRAVEVWRALDSMGIRTDYATIRNALDLAGAYVDLSRMTPDVLAGAIAGAFNASKPSAASSTRGWSPSAYRIAGALLVAVGGGTLAIIGNLAAEDGPEIFIDPGVLLLTGLSVGLIFWGGSMFWCGCGPGSRP